MIFLLNFYFYHWSLLIREKETRKVGNSTVIFRGVSKAFQKLAANSSPDLN